MKKGIAGKDEPEKSMFSMQTILNNNAHITNRKMILKMDVEGAEWDFLGNTASEILSQFSQITFELHGMTNINNEKQIIEVLTKLRETHTPIWIHANNAVDLEMAGDIKIPSCLGITYVSNKEYEFENVEYNCPISLDAPNIKGFFEIELCDW